MKLLFLESKRKKGGATIVTQKKSSDATESENTGTELSTPYYSNRS